jgi:serine/threonine protein kinase
MMTKTGTVAFTAPEVFTDKVYNHTVDVWSAGVVLYNMLSGSMPFFDESVPKLVSLITTNTPDFSENIFHDVSKSAISLIEKMLNKDPLKRPTISECLKSPWFD